MAFCKKARWERGVILESRKILFLGQDEIKKKHNVNIVPRIFAGHDFTSEYAEYVQHNKAVAGALTHDLLLKR